MIQHAVNYSLNKLPVVCLDKRVNRTIAKTAKHQLTPILVLETNHTNNTVNKVSTSVLRTIRIDGVSPSAVKGPQLQPSLDITQREQPASSKTSFPILTDSDQENSPIACLSASTSKDPIQTAKRVTTPLISPSSEDFVRWPGSCESSSPITSPTIEELPEESERIPVIEEQPEESEETEKESTTQSLAEKSTYCTVSKSPVGSSSVDKLPEDSHEIASEESDKRVAEKPICAQETNNLDDSFVDGLSAEINSLNQRGPESASAGSGMHLNYLFRLLVLSLILSVLYAYRFERNRTW